MAVDILVAQEEADEPHNKIFEGLVNIHEEVDIHNCTEVTHHSRVHGV